MFNVVLLALWRRLELVVKAEDMEQSTIKVNYPRTTLRQTNLIIMFMGEKEFMLPDNRVISILGLFGHWLGVKIMNFSAWFSATFAVLAVVNPVVTSALLMGMTANLPSAARWRTATSACLVILLILLVSALGGQYLLQMFGMTMDTFRIVGGVIVAYLGFMMFSGRMMPPTVPTVPTDLARLSCLLQAPGR